MVTSFDAFMDVLLPREVLADRAIRIGADSTVDMAELERKLAGIGYDREAQIEGPGQFAVRGGILDVYPLTAELPVRIELWGDEVDSIRSFDVETQRSIENLTEVLDLSGGGDSPGEGGKECPFWIISRSGRYPFIPG